MKRFCENCGHQISDTDSFCENCGHPVAVERAPASSRAKTPADQMNLFGQRAWAEAWKEAVSRFGNENVGLVVFNSRGAGNLDEFRSLLQQFVSFKAQQGVFYFALDLGDNAVGRAGQQVEDVLHLLLGVYRVAKAKYLLIVGDKASVGSRIYPHPYKEGDEKNIESDLPYTVLCADDPCETGKWNSFAFDAAIRVGRIPSRAQTGFAEACEYFRNAIGAELRSPMPYSVVMNSMRQVLRPTYNLLKGHCEFSPERWLSYFEEEGVVESNGGVCPNLMYFALHGSSSTHFWYGQRTPGEFEPNDETFSPEVLPQGSYVLCGICCYGAKPNAEGSMLNTALKKGCLAFLGSTRSAFGLFDNVMDFDEYADLPNEDFLAFATLMLDTFCRELLGGQTVGDAYVAGLKSVQHSDERLSENLSMADVLPICITTVEEFVLYGDPSVRFGSAAGTLRRPMAFGREEAPAFDSALHIPMPDVLHAVRTMLANVNAKIAERVNSFVSSRFGVGTKPTFLRVYGSKNYHALYKYGAEQYLVAVFSGEGDVLSVIGSC